MSQKMESKFTVYSRFNPPPSPSLECKDASLTRQEFAQESDINNIMRRYAGGLPPAPAGAPVPRFGDFSNVPDYQTALNKVIDAQQRFDALPSALRRRFDNDPAKLIDFLAHDENRSEAIDLGLIDKPVSVPDDRNSEGAEQDSARARTT